MGIPLQSSERFLLPVNLSLVYLLLLSIHGNVNPVRLLMVPMLPILGTVAALVGMDECTLLSGRCAGTRITPEELRQFPLTFVPKFMLYEPLREPTLHEFPLYPPELLTL